MATGRRLVGVTTVLHFHEYQAGHKYQAGHEYQDGHQRQDGCIITKIR